MYVWHSFGRSEHVHGILPDSGRPSLKVKELGGAGRVHDWEISSLLDLIARAVQRAAAGHTTEEFAGFFGLRQGVSGDTYHTVPVGLHAWFCSPNDGRSAILEIVRCGGDTDTSPAILGGILSARLGVGGLAAA